MSERALRIIRKFADPAPILYVNEGTRLPRTLLKFVDPANISSPDAQEVAVHKKPVIEEDTLYLPAGSVFTRKWLSNAMLSKLGSEYVTVANADGLAEAKRIILGESYKSNSEGLALVHRKMAWQITRVFLALRIPPNFTSFLSLVLNIWAASCSCLANTL